jgi:UDPglucose 6-dehydrogenase
MSEWDLKICCMGAGYVGGPTMAVIAKKCPKVRTMTEPNDEAQGRTWKTQERKRAQVFVQAMIEGSTKGRSGWMIWMDDAWLVKVEES